MQWERHIDSDDHHIIKFRAKLFPDGSIRFIYRNVPPQLKDILAKTGFPAIIGVQDGFAVQKPDGQKGGLLLHNGGILRPFPLNFTDP